MGNSANSVKEFNKKQPMKFFSNFAWAVPFAFADALATCRFEEGDVLYDTPKAYEDNWLKAKKHIHHSLQVRYPARAGSRGMEIDGGLFQNNWNTKVCFDLYNHNEDNKKEIETTQGRLYTALWKGDISLLEENADNPLIPQNFKLVTKRLSEDSEVKEKALSYKLFGPVFVMVRDYSNRTSVKKYEKVYSALSDYLSDNVLTIEPKHAGLNEWNKIAPTIDIAFFPTSNIEHEELEALVKKVFYVPTKGAKRDSYRLNNHGAIF